MNSGISIALQRAEEAISAEDHHKAQQLYQGALELLHIEIQRVEPASQAQQALILRFKEVLGKAETIKQRQIATPTPQQASERQAGQQTKASDSAASTAAADEYLQCKAQARTLAQKAVEADSSGQVATSLQLYFELLEVLNKCHKLETEPAVQAAIMARFQVYLERAEQLRSIQSSGAAAAPAAAAARD